MKNFKKSVIMLGLSLVMFMSVGNHKVSAQQPEKEITERMLEIANEQEISREEMKVQLAEEGYADGSIRFYVRNFEMDWYAEAIQCIEKYAKLDEVWSRHSLAVKMAKEDFIGQEVRHAFKNLKSEPNWKENAIVLGKKYATENKCSLGRTALYLADEDFTKEEREYAKKEIKLNWNKYALAKAKELMKSNQYSKSGLKSELIQDGYTEKQASYAVTKIKVDWKSQAVAVAKLLKSKQYEYTKEMSETWLKIEYKFTDKEIEYAISKVYK